MAPYLTKTAVMFLMAACATWLSADSPHVDVPLLCEESSVVLRAETVRVGPEIEVSITVRYRIVTFRLKDVLKGREESLSLMQFVPIDTSHTLKGKFINVICVVSTNTSDILPPNYDIGKDYALFLRYSASCLYARTPLDEYRREHAWVPKLEAQIKQALVPVRTDQGAGKGTIAE